MSARPREVVIRDRVDPNWRGAVPYVVLLSPHAPPRFSLGLPADAEIAAYVTGGVVFSALLLLVAWSRAYLQDMLDGFDRLETLASAPGLIIPGHDPLVRRHFPAAMAPHIHRLDLGPLAEVRAKRSG